MPSVLLYILAARLDGTAAISISPVASGVTNADASVAKSSNAYVFLAFPSSESLRSLTIPIAVGPAIAPILIVVVSSVCPSLPLLSTVFPAHAANENAIKTESITASNFFNFLFS